MFSNRHNESGQVLIESIVAISIGVVGLLGFLHLLTQAIAINKDVGQQSVATYLTAEGIEVVKSLIDANYVDGNAWGEGLADGSYEITYDSTALGSNLGSRSTTYLLYDSASGKYNYTTGNPTQFLRTVKLTNNNRSGTGGDDELKIVSIVEWATRDGTEEVKLEDHFFDWRL